MIVINLNMFQQMWQGVELDRVEAAIRVGASLAVWALDRDFAVGLRSNGIIAGSEGSPRIAPGAGPNQSTFLLEQMARLTFSGREMAETTLSDEASRLGAGDSLVFVTSVLTPDMISVLSSKKLAGRVSVVYCGRFAAPLVRGLPVYLAAPPQEQQRAAS
jgi:uncharacterized protein (DUF58 family)